MKVTFAKPEVPTQGAYIVGVMEGRKLTAAATQAEKATKGAISRSLNASRFKGGHDEQLLILAPQGLEVSRLILAGLGNPAKLDGFAVEAIGGRLIAALNGAGEREATIAVEALAGCPLNEAEIAARLATGARLRAYRFDKYRTKEKPEHKPTLKKLTITLGDPNAAKKAFDPLDKIADSVMMTRNLVSEPANVIYPATLAKEAATLAELGVKIEVLGEKEMKKLGMGALLGVGQGSERESQLVTMQWNGASDSKAKPICFVGKGVTFDTGGISIKPAAGMEDMKWDMGGSGVVIGLMRALAARKAKVNAVGVIGLVENMPSGTAQRPGDIVTSMSGQTIEVLNTDAEGRLVLADALWYAQENFRPKAIVDLATLTGAIMVALGTDHAGLFSNDDTLSDQLVAAGKATGELLWRMPLAPSYDRLIDSPAADMKNIGGRYGGSITAAQFLQRFIQKGTPWAHLDIAGVTWSEKDKPTTPKGATAFGVRLLEQLVAREYEDK
ncbi:leucyl aminopeptidase [Dongia sp.]|uniref:leucyl aminopeptidase n=1 Tax=Dongia sp. TaxID=1977262 RepID=UPI0035B19C92